jgi:hypothetical protein
VEKEPKEQTPGDQPQPGSEEPPPPFQPDYELITVLERGGKEERRFRREVEDRQRNSTADRS